MSDRTAITTRGENPLDVNPFRQNLPGHANVGTVSAEQHRAVADVLAMFQGAKMFPRDEAAAYDRVMAACSRPSLAAVAEYAYPRGGQTVRGPSIRLAEELARSYGNIEYGIRELSRTDGVSEMQAYAWDIQTNVRSVQNFTVRHIRDKKGGGQQLTDERDIYEVTANMGGRRLRARLLAVLPPDLVDAAIEQCRRTLAGNAQEPIADRIKKVIGAFSRYGVKSSHLSEYLGKKLDDVVPDDIADLQSVFNSIKSGESRASDFFGAGARQETAEAEEETRKPANDNRPTVNQAAQSKAAKTQTEKADDQQQAEEPESDTKPEPEKKPAAKSSGGTGKKAAAKKPEPEPEPEQQQQEPEPQADEQGPADSGDGNDLF